MNGIEKITERLMADASAETAALKAESDGRCAQIRAENERRAQNEYERLVAEGAKETEQRAQRMDRTAGLEARKSILSMKQQQVQSAFELAREKIVSLPEQDYVGFLARQAAAAAVTGQEELIFSDEDRARVGAKVTKAANALLSGTDKYAMLTLSEATRPMSGGLILKQGDIEVNCTVDTLLELQRAQLAAQVAEVLFEG